MRLYERNVMTQAPLPEDLTGSDPGGQPEWPSAGGGSGMPPGNRDTELRTDRPVPVSVVLDRLRNAAAAHDGDLPAVPVLTVPGRAVDKADQVSAPGEC